MNTAHQYQIRQEAAQTEAATIPFDVTHVSLAKARISQILPVQAKEVILKYEWLRSMPMAPRFYWGVWFEVDGVEYLGGVLIYSTPKREYLTAWAEYGVTESNILELSRGACTWWTPKNTASWFISQVHKWLLQNTAYRIITAKINPESGEVGTIFQASNWDYTGLNLGQSNLEITEAQRFKVLIDGELRTGYSLLQELGSLERSVILSKYPTAKFIEKYRSRRYFCFIGASGRKFRKNFKPFFQIYPSRTVGDTESLLAPRIGYIYRITNKINNKVYIGQTVRPLNVRFAEYRRGGGNSHLQAAFDKYGYDSFIFEEVAQSTSLAELNRLEREWINTHQCTQRDKGYNMGTGGNNAMVSEETRAKMSAAGKGRKQSAEHIARKNAKAGTEEAKKYGRTKTEEEKQYLSEKGKEVAYWKGKKRDPETVAKQKAALTGGKLSAEAYANFIAVSGVAVKVTDPDGTVHEFPTLEAAGKHMGVSKQTARSYANGKFKSKAGYQVELKK